MGNVSLSVYHRMMPIALSHTGKIWLMLCPSNSAAKNYKRVVYMQKKNSDYRLKFNVKTQLWEKNSLYFPNCNRDKSILALASQGLSINEIADVLQMTPDAVKACRRRVFEQSEQYARSYNLYDEPLLFEISREFQLIPSL